MQTIKQWFEKFIGLFKKPKKMGSTIIIKPSDTATDIANTNLIKDKESDGEGRKKLYQYSKKITNIITFFSLVWISWSYVLCTIIILKWGNSQATLESLSTAVCQTILSVLCVYFAKSLLETALEKKTEKDILFKKIDTQSQEMLQKISNGQIVVPPSVEEPYVENDDEAVG